MCGVKSTIIITGILHIDVEKKRYSFTHRRHRLRGYDDDDDGSNDDMLVIIIMMLMASSEAAATAAEATTNSHKWCWWHWLAFVVVFIVFPSSPVIYNTLNFCGNGFGLHYAWLFVAMLKSVLRRLYALLQLINVIIINLCCSIFFKGVTLTCDVLARESERIRYNPLQTDLVDIFTNFLNLCENIFLDCTFERGT